MRKVICILLTIQGLLLDVNVSYGQAGSLRSATLESVGFTIETIADISCENFDKTFNGNEKKTKFIFNPADIAQLELLAKEFKEVKPLHSFDVRGSVNFIGFDKTTSKYCFNVFGYFYKDGKYYFNKQLLIFISDNLFKNHPKYLDTLRK